MCETNPKLTSKEVADYFRCTPRTARTYLSDIKKEYGLKFVLKSHFEKYFKVSIEV